jgi:hypothetical protein
MAWFFHFVSAVEMLVQAHHWVPVGVREVQSLLGLAVVSVFFLVWWLYDAISLGLFALPVTFFLVLIPALGPDRYTFPSQGVRVSWLIAHIAALLLAYVALGFSLLASILYLVQERRLKAKPKARFLTGEDSWWAPLDWLPPLDTLERISEAMLEFGFPCMTVGLVIGVGAGPGNNAGRGRIFSIPRSLRPLSAGPSTWCCCWCGERPACAGARLLIFPGRFCGDGGGVDGQPLQPRAQVRCPMTLALIGVNYKTAPIALRERIAISREELPETTRALAAVEGVTECMIVSTCNRVELLAAVESPDDRSDRLPASAVWPGPGAA